MIASDLLRRHSVEFPPLLANTDGRVYLDRICVSRWHSADEIFSADPELKESFMLEFQDVLVRPLQDSCVDSFGSGCLRKVASPDSFFLFFFQCTSE